MDHLPILQGMKKKEPLQKTRSLTMDDEAWALAYQLAHDLYLTRSELLRRLIREAAKKAGRNADKRS